MSQKKRNEMLRVLETLLPHFPSREGRVHMKKNVGNNPQFYFEEKICEHLQVLQVHVFGLLFT
jgi:hypothetical protein